LAETALPFLQGHLCPEFFDRCGHSLSEVPDSEQQHEAATGCPASVANKVTALSVQQQTDGPKSVDPMSSIERAVRHMSYCSPKKFTCLNRSW
jgi:hypothetical protein